MARKKLIEDDALLKLIKDYYLTQCNGDASRLKLPEITKYINSCGYPDYRVTTLRRNGKARDYINELKSKTETATIQSLMSYKTLDVDAFLRTNRTAADLKRALAELDTSYRMIVQQAITIYENNKKEQDKAVALSRQFKKLKSEKNDQEEIIKNLKQKIKVLEAEEKRLKSYIRDTVYPELADDVLVQTGELKKPKTNGKKILHPVFTAGSSMDEIENTDAKAKKTSPSNTVLSLMEAYKK